MRENYGQIVRDALHSLGGDARYVPGAKLLQAVQRGAQAAQLDFRADLLAENLRFGEYLETLAPNVLVHKRGAADMLVGLETARFEIPEGSRRTGSYDFRPDVYRAFSGRENVAFSYNLETDEFSNADIESGIPVTISTRQDAIEQRRRFAMELPAEEPRRTVLIDSLESDKPLTAFRAALSATNLADDWFAYKNRQLRSSIEKWASDNKVRIRQSWFSKIPHQSLKSIWSRMADLLTEEEIKTMSVPMRVVEAFLRRIG